jgi:hypothetical protein
LSEEFSAPPKWIFLSENKSIDALSSGEFRNMKPFKFQSMMSPYLEMECVDKKVTMETGPSKSPTPDDPNFLQRLVMPVMLSDNALFAPPLALRARDLRLLTLFIIEK